MSAFITSRELNCCPLLDQFYFAQNATDPSGKRPVYDDSPSARNRVPKGGSEKRAAAARARDPTIVAEMKTICDEFEAYGYRRVDAELRHRGIVVNAKKIPRLNARACVESKAAQAFSRDDG
jgi:hypothetical protein